MRKILILSSLVFVLLVYGLFLGQYNIRIIEDQLEPPNPPDLYDYHGATHVHSDKNLGSGTYLDIVAQAQEAGLDFLFFTDLNTFNRNMNVEGYHRKTLVLMGASYSYLDSRILVYDSNKPYELETIGQAQMLLADLLSQSGKDADQDLLVLAHPFKPGFSWTGAYPSGLDGIEVINLKSVWQNAWNSSKISFFWSVLVYPFNSQLALLRLYDEPREELRLWDTLNVQQRTIGFAGNDSTARTGSVSSNYLRFPSYQVTLGLVSNHVLLSSELTGEPESDRRKILEALANGQFYLSLDLLGNPKGFNATIEDGTKTYLMGSKLKFKRGLKMSVHLPQKPRVPFESVLIKDGERIQTANERDAEFAINEPGVYRVIVRVIPTLPLPDGKRWITWLYTNPFRVE